MRVKESYLTCVKQMALNAINQVLTLFRGEQWSKMVLVYGELNQQGLQKLEPVNIELFMDMMVGQIFITF